MLGSSTRALAGVTVSEIDKHIPLVSVFPVCEGNSLRFLAWQLVWKSRERKLTLCTKNRSVIKKFQRWRDVQQRAPAASDRRCNSMSRSCPHCCIFELRKDGRLCRFYEETSSAHLSNKQAQCDRTVSVKAQERLFFSANKAAAAYRMISRFVCD